MEALLKALKSHQGLADWKINLTTTKSTELFYVQKQVETNRGTDVTDINVTIYVDQDGKRGLSSFAVYPYMGEKEISALIDENIYAAKFTFNTYFDLPSPKDVAQKDADSNLSKTPFKELIGQIGEAIMKANHFENGSLSATEIFLNQICKRVINSRGIDVSSTSYECRIETIPNWVKEDKEEVELYKSIEFSSFDPEALTKEVEETLLLAKARSEAVALPKLGETAIILENEEVDNFFDAFVWDLSYRAKYTHANHFEVGKPIQENRTGDILDIELRPNVEGCLDSSYVDHDGVTLSDVKIIENGIAKRLHGSYQFGYYLGEKSPTGSIPVTYVKEGEDSVKDWEKKPYIRCVRFSGIQVDIDSGFVGGEVRLGFYFDGEKEIPVTGFSIQADFHELKDSFRCSKERVNLPSYSGPKYLFIPKAKIV